MHDCICATDLRPGRGEDGVVLRVREEGGDVVGGPPGTAIHRLRLHLLLQLVAPGKLA